MACSVPHKQRSLIFCSSRVHGLFRNQNAALCRLRAGRFSLNVRRRIEVVAITSFTSAAHYSPFTIPRPRLTRVNAHGSGSQLTAHGSRLTVHHNLRALKSQRWHSRAEARVGHVWAGWQLGNNLNGMEQFTREWHARWWWRTTQEGKGSWQMDMIGVRTKRSCPRKPKNVL